MEFSDHRQILHPFRNSLHERQGGLVWQSITGFTFVHLEHGYEEHVSISASVLQQHATPLVEDVCIQSNTMIWRMPTTDLHTARLLSVVRSTSLASKVCVQRRLNIAGFSSNAMAIGWSRNAGSGSFVNQKVYIIHQCICIGSNI